jgi:hypothetical protein
MFLAHIDTVCPYVRSIKVIFDLNYEPDVANERIGSERDLEGIVLLKMKFQVLRVVEIERRGVIPEFCDFDLPYSV